jgi:CubicO group peptidase (beta-lactamase class C family)
MTVATRPAAPSAALEAVLPRLDEIADRTFAAWNVPGLVYGVVRDGALVHSRGIGTLRVGEDATPTSGSVFRIASMTKSFTAATVMLLRDEGRLRLDDEAARYVPELAAVELPTRDSPPITIRHLLTMTAGFPTDDPWGDRQQGLDLGEFSRILSGGLSFAWAPGTRFEYSNLGYGILGRLITNLAGREYREVVRDRFLGPLGMASSGYLAEEVEPERLALGYLWRDRRFVDEPMDDYGAFASMGGLFTTVDDLSRWVAGFQDAWPPRDDAEGGHPLSRASRREMQQPMVPADGGLRSSAATADALPDVESLHYGFGLFQVDDLRFGRTIGHGGGYPGFGSNMRWHPSSGLGVIVLANARYAPASLLAKELLGVLLHADVAPPRRTRPNARTRAAREGVERLLAAWDDALAAKLFAMNVELDEPLASRKAVLERIRERHGRLTPDREAPGQSVTSHHQAWWLTGERGGRVRVEIQLSPELPPRVQTLAITSVPEPPPAVRHAAEQLVHAINTGGKAGADWPAEVAVGTDVDLATARRQLRAAEARFGPVELGPVVDGDGERKATFRLHGARGHLDLALTHDPDAACVAAVAIVPVKLVPPDLD